MKIKVVSFNFLTWSGGTGDGINNFLHRVGPIFEKLFAEKPDLIGFQEVSDRQLVYLSRLLPDYEFAGQARETDLTGEGTYIAVKKDSFRILAFNTFWLSPTPYVPGSRFEEQSSCPRICNTVRLFHRESGTVLRMFNTHLDHIGEQARVLGMKCILSELERLEKTASFPVIITGDMNALPESEAMTMCRSFSPVRLTDVTADLTSTFHDFEQRKNIKIDYIYMSEDLASRVSAAGLWDDVRNGCYLSDHYPVWAETELG